MGLNASDVRRLPKAVRDRIGPLPKAPHKMRANPINDATGKRIYDSGKEERRHIELSIRERVGEISNLEPRRKWDLIVNGELVTTYRCDFAYNLVRSGRLVVEDVKPFDRKSGTFRTTEPYRLRKKLMWAIHSIRIQEV